MSNAIFPTFPGLEWSVYKAPEWDTSTQRAVSGKEVRRANRQRPIWRFTLSYSILRGANLFAEYQTLMAFYNARQGAFDSFLLSDASDNTATDQVIGAGDGVRTVFPLVHAIGGWTEPIGYAAAAVVKVNGVVNGAAVFNADRTGIVFPGAAPAAGASVTWSGAFYYRVRFDKDTMEFEQFMKDFWALKKCEMTGVI